MRIVLIALAGAAIVSALTIGSGVANPEAVLALRLDRPSYLAKQPIQVTLEVKNKSDRAIRLTFPSSQRFELRLEDETGKEIWSWSRGRLFLQMLGEEVLEPSTNGLLYRETIPAPANPGRYILSARITSEDRPLRAMTPLIVR